MDFLYGINFCLALQMALLIRFRKYAAGHRADRFLVAYMVGAAALFFLLWVNSRVSGLPVPVSLFAGGTGFLLLLGLFLAYMLTLVGRTGAYLYLAFLPFAVVFCWQMIDASLHPVKYDALYGVTTLTVTTDWDRWQGPLILVATLAFPVVGLRLLSAHRRNLKNQHSNVAGIDLDWIRKAWSAIAISVAIAAIVSSPLLATANVPLQASVATLFTSVSALHFYVGWHGIEQTQIEYVSRNAWPSKPRLDPDVLSDSVSELNRYMEEQRPYLEGTLTLVQLADRLGWPRRKLSAVLRDGVERNFFDFVNAYRVAEVKRQLSDAKYAAVTLLAVALDAGFNSKTTFNKVFKKFEGVSPSQFRRSRFSGDR